MFAGRRGCSTRNLAPGWSNNFVLRHVCVYADGEGGGQFRECMYDMMRRSYHNIEEHMPYIAPHFVQPPS